MSRIGEQVLDEETRIAFRALVREAIEAYRDEGAVTNELSGERVAGIRIATLNRAGAATRQKLGLTGRCLYIVEGGDPQISVHLLGEGFQPRTVSARTGLLVRAPFADVEVTIPSSAAMPIGRIVFMASDDPHAFDRLDAGETWIPFEAVLGSSVSGLAIADLTLPGAYEYVIDTWVHDLVTAGAAGVRTPHLVWRGMRQIDLVGGNVVTGGWISGGIDTGLRLVSDTRFSGYHAARVDVASVSDGTETFSYSIFGAPRWIGRVPAGLSGPHFRARVDGGQATDSHRSYVRGRMRGYIDAA